MKVQNFQGDKERSILTGMIVSDRVLARLFAHLKSEKKPFRSKWCNIVGKWCLNFHQKFEKAPRKSIQFLFNEFAEKSQDEDTVALVEKFLTDLSGDYKTLAHELNEDHLIDSASKFFNEVRLERLQQALAVDLENHEIEEAEKKIAQFAPVSLGTSDMVDVFTDEDLVRDALVENESDILVHYKGALGELFGDILTPDNFIAFLAPEKRGKSMVLLDVAWRAAVLSKRKTVIYSIGDMTQRQMMRRCITRAARRPIHPVFGEKAVLFPLGLRVDRESVADVSSERREWKEKISISEARAAMKKIHIRTAQNDSMLKMRCTPAGTTNMADIASDLEGLSAMGWDAQVVVIDYLDIAAPEPGIQHDEYRHRIDENWKAARRISQKHHCLVATATQSDADGGTVKILRRGNFSENKRKWAHPTGIFGINQTEEEKEQGVMRINCIMRREGNYSEGKCVTTAGSLALANPFMFSV